GAGQRREAFVARIEAAEMSASFGILRVAPFAGFVQRFDDLIGSATTMSLYFIHSRRWRENHDAAIKAFVGMPTATSRVWRGTSANPPTYGCSGVTRRTRSTNSPTARCLPCIPTPLRKRS